MAFHYSAAFHFARCFASDPPRRSREMLYARVRREGSGVNGSRNRKWNPSLGFHTFLKIMSRHGHEECFGKREGRRCFSSTPVHRRTEFFSMHSQEGECGEAITSSVWSVELSKFVEARQTPLSSSNLSAAAASTTSRMVVTLPLSHVPVSPSPQGGTREVEELSSSIPRVTPPSFPESSTPPLSSFAEDKLRGMMMEEMEDRLPLFTSSTCLHQNPLLKNQATLKWSRFPWSSEDTSHKGVSSFSMEASSSGALPMARKAVPKERARLSMTTVENEEVTEEPITVPLSTQEATPMKEARTLSPNTTTPSTTKKPFLYPGREDLPPLQPLKTPSKFSFLAHYSHASTERNYDVNSEVPNSIPKPKLPMWASSFTHPALEKERLCEENWISQDAGGFLSPPARNALEEWLTTWLRAVVAAAAEQTATATTAEGATPRLEETTTSDTTAMDKRTTSLDVVEMMRQNVYVHPRKASFRGVFAKKSFQAGEVVLAIPLSTLGPTATPAGPAATMASLASTKTARPISMESTSLEKERPHVVHLTTLTRTTTPYDPAVPHVKHTVPCSTGACSRSAITVAAMHTESLQECLQHPDCFPCFGSPSPSLEDAPQGENKTPHSSDPSSASRFMDHHGGAGVSPSLSSTLPPFSLVMDYMLSMKRSSLDPTPHILFMEQVYLAMQLAVILEDYERRVGGNTETREEEEEKRKKAVSSYSTSSLPLSNRTADCRGKEKESDANPASSASTTTASRSPSTTPCWGPYLYLLRYGVPPPLLFSMSKAERRAYPSVSSPLTPKTTTSCTSPPPPLPLFDDEGIKERHKWVLEPQTYLEYSDLCLRFRHLLRGLHSRWWNYYQNIRMSLTLSRASASFEGAEKNEDWERSHGLPSSPPPPSLETLEWALRVVLSRQRQLPQQRRGLKEFHDLVRYTEEKDGNEAHGWFARTVMQIKWWVYEKVLGAVDRARLHSNAIPDPTVMPAVLPLLDLLQHAPGGRANTTVSFEEGLPSVRASSSSSTADSNADTSRVLYAVVRAAEAIEEDEELTTLYSKCYSVAYTLYRYGSLALHKRQEDIRHLMDENER